MRLLCFWLIFAPAGLSLSLDHWLKQRKEPLDPKAAPWAQRLMQINMSLLYAQAFMKKIIGITWQNGSAVYFSSLMVEMQRFPMVTYSIICGPANCLPGPLLVLSSVSVH